MQFLLFDVGATLAFLAGYQTVVTLQRRRALPVPKPADRQNRLKWPRLSAPR